MPTSLKQILEQARALSTEDRAKLVNSLLESPDSPQSDIEKAWAEEIEQRLAAFDRGEISAYPAEDVFADARRISR
ncbi:addiction module protein [Peristeroidobacter soli]|jgi:putative addiction module component (TIGR02574 family)|uniref:addiction module protein n=1 Tax=Peristeroidobacter soli TaxID=2497877 RepID=UPI00101C4B3F|nr:addiction module protein [Peristeroidobacter soli]